MGSRIRKVMGYALTDLQTQKGKGWVITDPRINTNSPLLNEETFDDKYDSMEEGFEDYKAFLKSDKAVRRSLDSDREIDAFVKSNNSYWNLVTHAGEMAKARVLVVTPLSMLKDWQRSDDYIDHAEASILKDPMKTRLHVFNNGFYPFNANLIDKRNPEKRVDSYLAAGYLRAINSVKKFKGIASLNASQLESVRRYAEELGLTAAEAIDNLVPEPPSDIVNLTRWAELFTDSKFVYDLKPVLYTYWA